jgi:hypothetical protein
MRPGGTRRSWFAAGPTAGYSAAAVWQALRGEPDPVHEAATLG